MTLFQKRFARALLGLFGAALTSFACLRSSACFLFLATLCSASDADGVGVSGGGPGTEGWGSGVARRTAVVCRHWYSGRETRRGAPRRREASAGRIDSMAMMDETMDGWGTVDDAGGRVPRRELLLHVPPPPACDPSALHLLLGAWGMYGMGVCQAPAAGHGYPR